MICLTADKATVAVYVNVAGKVNDNNEIYKMHFIHMPTVTCSYKHIENSKNHKKVTLPTITLPKSAAE